MAFYERGDVRINYHDTGSGEGQTDRPGAGEHLGVFNSRFVADRIPADGGVAFHDVQRVALERIRKIHRTRHARHIACQFRVAVQPVGGVLLLSPGSPGLVRNLVAFHNPQSRRYPTGRSQGYYRGRQDRNIRVHASLGDHRVSLMGLEVPIRRTVRLPDAAEVGPTVRRANELSNRAFRCRFAVAPHSKRRTRNNAGGNDDDYGVVRMIVRRPDVNRREVLETGELDVAEGLVGDNWRWGPQSSR